MGLLSAGASLLGGKAEGRGYKQAEKLFKELKTVAPKAREMADPFHAYRGQMADRLYGILSGEEDFTTDPGYQFRLSEAMRETERGAAARGFNQSGNVMAAMNRRAQDVASEEYQNIIGRLMELSGAGSQNAVAGAQIYGNIMTDAISGQAGARIGRGQSQSAMFGGIASGIGGAISGFATGGIKGMF